MYCGGRTGGLWDFWVGLYCLDNGNGRLVLGWSCIGMVLYWNGLVLEWSCIGMVLYLDGGMSR